MLNNFFYFSAADLAVFVSICWTITYGWTASYLMRPFRRMSDYILAKLKVPVRLAEHNRCPVCVGFHVGGIVMLIHSGNWEWWGMMYFIGGCISSFAIGFIDPGYDEDVEEEESEVLEEEEGEE